MCCRQALKKGAIEEVSPYQMKSGIYNWYLLTISLRFQSIRVLPWWLADSSAAQRLGASASRLCSRSFVRSEPEDESSEECSTAEAVDCVSWVRISLSLDADMFLSWTVVHIPGAANLAANILSKQGLRPLELRLFAQIVILIWKQFGRVEVYLLLANSSVFSKVLSVISSTSVSRYSCVAMGTLYAFPHVKLIPLVLMKVWEERVQLSLVSRDGLILWSGFSPDGTYIGDSSQSQPLILCLGHRIASLAKYLETLGLVSKQGSSVEFGLYPGEKKITLSARAPSTARLYALRWKLFVSCSRNWIHLFPILCAGWDVKTFLYHLHSFLWVICGPERSHRSSLWATGVEWLWAHSDFTPSLEKVFCNLRYSMFIRLLPLPSLKLWCCSRFLLHCLRCRRMRDCIGPLSREGVEDLHWLYKPVV